MNEPIGVLAIASCLLLAIYLRFFSKRWRRWVGYE